MLTSRQTCRHLQLGAGLVHQGPCTLQHASKPAQGTFQKAVGLPVTVCAGLPCRVGALSAGGFTALGWSTAEWRGGCSCCQLEGIGNTLKGGQTCCTCLAVTQATQHHCTSVPEADLCVHTQQSCIVACAGMQYVCHQHRGMNWWGFRGLLHA